MSASVALVLRESFKGRVERVQLKAAMAEDSMAL